jgi:hypothetical protein
MNTAPTIAEHDLFGQAIVPPLLVRLDRTTDRLHPCCDNLAVLRPGKAPHVAELRCANCNRHRGWLPKAVLDFLTTTAQRFGASADPIILRDSTVGDHVMAKATYDDSNRGALFRNQDKQKESDRDYSGSLNVGGIEYWISGWVRESKNGKKYLAIALKPKNEAAGANNPKAGGHTPFNDEIPFAPEWR